MERARATGAREHGRDAAAARLVRGAAVRLALALGIASFTAALSLAALSARTAAQAAQAAAPAAARPLVDAGPVRPAAASTPGAGGGPAVTALRTDI